LISLEKAQQKHKQKNKKKRKRNEREKGGLWRGGEEERRGGIGDGRRGWV